jgi:hypothetical protein
MKILNKSIEKNYEEFGRKKFYHEAYLQEKIANKKVYNTPGDMIKLKYMNYIPVMKEDKLIAKYHKCSESIVLTDNNYPYYVEAEHKLLWSSKELNNDEVNNILAKKLFGKEFIYFRNPPHMRSIPNLFHIHIFIKKE